MSELNKQKVRLFVDAVLNEGRLDLIDELVAADYVGRVPWTEREIVGREELRQLLTQHRLNHSHLYIKIEDEIGEDDLVALRWRATARTPEGDPTDRHPGYCSGISIVHVLAGRQVDAFTALAGACNRVAIPTITDGGAPARRPYLEGRDE